MQSRSFPISAVIAAKTSINLCYFLEKYSYKTSSARITQVTSREMLSEVFVTIEIFRKLKLRCVVLAKTLLFLITPAFLLKLITFF
jgi:hypothetical protein